MKSKIYIAGKVTGEKIHEVTMKFGKAQKQLEALGYQAINPLEVVNDWKADWKDAMKLCIKALVDCDAVFFLPDWDKSKGAMLEMTLALTLEMPVYTSIENLKSNITEITDVAMSSSGLTRKNYQMNRKLTNNNNQTESTNTAITYSLCYAPFFNHEI